MGVRTLENQNCVLDVLVRVIQVKGVFVLEYVCGLDDCKEVHHRLLHRQAINKNSTLNKNSGDAINLHQQQTGCNVNNDVPQQQKHVDVNPSVKTADLISEGRLLIEMKMPQ